MKIIKTVFFVCALLLMNTNGVVANNPPVQLPNPTAKSSGGAIANAAPGEEPPGGPIDENLLFLTISALLLGSVVIYKNKLKKASV
jgi:hypothetical protein